MKEARAGGYRTLDLSNVEFVSRSVADEFLHLSDEFEIELDGLHGDARSMIEVVSEQLSAAAE
jgi:hypothetical protein